MKYKLLVAGSDPLGFQFLENVVEMAGLGATIDDTLPFMKFPHRVYMVLEAETPPVPTATIRVFEYDTQKEVFAAFIQPEASEFSLDVEKVDKSLNGDVPWTKEQLEGMDFHTEFKDVMRDAEVGGKQRDKMTRDYLAKFAK